MMDAIEEYQSIANLPETGILRHTSDPRLAPPTLVNRDPGEQTPPAMRALPCSFGNRCV
jgi:hypothetical protein